MKSLHFFIKHLLITVLLCTAFGWAIQLKAQTNSTSALTIQYKTVGNASTIDAGTNEFQLTPDNFSKAGGVWSQTTLDPYKCFTIKAQLNFGAHDYGADGITFVLSKNYNVLGQIGGYLGYQGIGASGAVEFDTWQNAEFNDPPSDHLAFLKKGSVIHKSNNKYVFPLPNIETGNYYDVTFTWDVNTKLFTVHFLDNDYVCPIDSLISDSRDYPQLYFGFTGATGGASNSQLVKIISVENDCPATLANRTSGQAAVNNNKLTANISPNPAQSEFKMELQGVANAPISVRIMDANGKLVKTYNNLFANQVLRFGSELQKGIYFAEVSQKDQKKVVKLVKL